jgi:hypothetical protein
METAQNRARLPSIDDMIKYMYSLSGNWKRSQDTRHCWMDKGQPHFRNNFNLAVLWTVYGKWPFQCCSLLKCDAMPIHMQVPTLQGNLLPPSSLKCWCLTWHPRRRQSQKDNRTIHKLKGDIISYHYNHTSFSY